MSQAVTRVMGISFRLEDKIVNDLGADSLDTIEMVMELEVLLNIHIPDDDFENMITCQEMFDYLDFRLNGTKKKKLLEYK